jgi:hypothetical protein
MGYYNTYGKIHLAKGTVLYHWSKEDNINLYNNNFFLCLNNSFWSCSNKLMYKYKLITDINLILTIQNDNISNNQTYSLNNKRQDYEVLTKIFNDTITNTFYDKHSDVVLKTNQPDFSNLCKKLTSDKYEGLFNYIDSDKGRFEIVIFEPDKHLMFIETKKYENVKLHKLSDFKRIMLSKKINFNYPNYYHYKNINKRETNYYPSIFYYIYKKGATIT